jgi:hypothetical protein
MKSLRLIVKISTAVALISLFCQASSVISELSLRIDQDRYNPFDRNNQTKTLRLYLNAQPDTNLFFTLQRNQHDTLHRGAVQDKVRLMYFLKSTPLDQDSEQAAIAIELDKLSDRYSDNDLGSVNKEAVFYLQIPNNQLLKPGHYHNEIQINIYQGQLSSQQSAQFVESQTLPITLSVAEVMYVRQVENQLSDSLFALFEKQALNVTVFSNMAYDLLFVNDTQAVKNSEHGDVTYSPQFLLTYEPNQQKITHHKSTSLGTYLPSGLTGREHKINMELADHSLILDRVYGGVYLTVAVIE